MKVAMKLRRDMIAVACDSFMKMFQIGDDELVEQVSTDDVQHVKFTLLQSTNSLQLNFRQKSRAAYIND